jgi:hypothetical protein
VRPRGVGVDPAVPMDLEPHRDHGNAAQDRDQAGSRLERLQPTVDGELALGVDEDAEVSASMPGMVRDPEAVVRSPLGQPRAAQTRDWRG